MTTLLVEYLRHKMYFTNWDFEQKVRFYKDYKKRTKENEEEKEALDWAFQQIYDKKFEEKQNHQFGYRATGPTLHQNYPKSN